MKRIGIDIHCAEGRISGLGRTVEQLWTHLKKMPMPDCEYRFLTRSKPSKDMNTLRRLYWENSEVPRFARTEKLDLLHVPAFAVPALKPCKLVLTVHDLIGMTFPNQKGLPSKLYWGKWLPWTSKHADAIITISEHSKKDIVQYLHIPESKVHVILLSGHEHFKSNIELQDINQVKESLGIDEEYFLFVGTLEPRKNLARTIQAFSQFLRHKKVSTRYQLVLVGAKDFGHGTYFEQTLKPLISNEKDIVCTDYIDHDTLNRLYAGARALAFPSLYEGFGFPVLEAMGSGTTVITSNTTSLPEVAGDAAYYVNPMSLEEIEQAFKFLAEDDSLRNDLLRRSKKRLSLFSWQKTTLQTQNVYRKLLNL